MKRFFREKLWLFYLPVSIFYMELLLKFWCFGALTVRGAIFTLLFSLAAGCLLTALTAIGKQFHSLAFGVILLVLPLLYGVQAVYYHIFKTFLVLYSIGGAGNAIGSFWREALTGIWQSLPVIVPLFFPGVLWLIFRKRLSPRRFFRRTKWRLAAVFVLLQLSAVLAVLGSTSGVMSPRYLYFDTYVPEHTVRYFGAITNLRLDIQNLLFPKSGGSAPVETPAASSPVSSPGASVQPGESAAPTETPAAYAPNVLEIDWEDLIANEADATVREMHEYFSQVEPTMENAYTGMFEGKNLIWIVAEGFSSWAMDETHTPTLWKLAHSGFVFENFYNPLWYVSTSDGEFTTLLSLLPRSGVWSMSRSSACSMPFAMGNLMGNEGYNCFAFHDGSLTYYDRDKSLPNMGYDFKADGAGLDLSSAWPTSDLEMMEQSIPMYIGEEPFHTYYMTISGHMNYNFYGNNMAAKHEEDVADLPYSDAARAYVACNMELDLAMEELLNELEAAGILEDTVIVLSGDHYPYGLTQSEIEELNGGAVEQNFELYRSSLILYCADMEETVTVDKYCCAMDILPTLCNLFGLDYDSRLLVGRDIFSDAGSRIIFGNRSFITDEGRYDASTDTFTPNADSTLTEAEANAYAARMLEEVGLLFQYSANIIDLDYYGKVLSQ